MKKSADRYGPILSEIIAEDNLADSTERGSSFRDFLRFVAMRRSLGLADEYEKLSDFSDAEEQKSFFSELADLKRHEVEILMHYHSDGRIVSLGAKRPLPLAVRPDDQVKKNFSNLEKACRFAMSKELENYCLYLRLADLEEETVTKRLFLYLVRMHKSSLDYVQNRLQLIAGLHELKDKADAARVCADYSEAQVA